ncbi:hypothetical protein VP01_10145g1, partial [Puccinia sorghi]
NLISFISFNTHPTKTSTTRIPQANSTNHPPIYNSPASTQPNSMSRSIPPSATGTISQTTTPTPSQRRPSRAKGSVGLSSSDCMALVAAVRQFPPLGSQEWLYVQEQYNNTNFAHLQPTQNLLVILTFKLMYERLRWLKRLWTHVPMSLLVMNLTAAMTS